MDRVGADTGLARPYEVADGVAKPVPHEWYHTAPSSSLAASAADMAQFLRAHLGDGCAGARCILRPASARAMRTEQVTLHPRLPGWGLGFQLRRSRGRSLVEHGGNIGGFASMLVMMPDARLGIFVVHHGEGEDLWRPVVDAVLDAVVPAPPVTPPRRVPRTRAELARYAGRYRANIYCRSCADPGWVQDFDVAVNDDLTLSLAGRRWVPAGDDYFVREDGGDEIGFHVEAGRVLAITGGSFRIQERLDPAP
jgi:CubicO group peptidase (beta-lactamase class C family)